MTRRTRLLACVVALALLVMVPAGLAKVVHENPDNLPPGCQEVSEEVEITVRGGREAAEAFPGAAFTFSERSWDLPACARVTVTFVNEDPIRHQFMIHDTWPNGFTMAEVDGPGNETVTFILPNQQKTLLVHCGVAQHQQKGMKAEILVDGGVGHLPNILGISGIPAADSHGAPAGQSTGEDQTIPGVGLPALALLALAAAALWPRRRA